MSSSDRFPKTNKRQQHTYILKQMDATRTAGCPRSHCRPCGCCISAQLALPRASVTGLMYCSVTLDTRHFQSQTEYPSTKHEIWGGPGVLEDHFPAKGTPVKLHGCWWEGKLLLAFDGTQGAFSGSRRNLWRDSNISPGGRPTCKPKQTCCESFPYVAHTEIDSMFLEELERGLSERTENA